MSKGRKIRIVFVLFLSVVIGVAVLGGCSEPEEVPEPIPEPVVVAPPPEPEPEPEPEPVFTLPLTGEEVDEFDPRLVNRPLSVKIENTPESRPALGITKADVVYETITEGGITRFNAFFHSEIPEDIGSVRSARNSDVTIVPEYDALFVFSGTNSLVWADIGKTWINSIEEGTAGPALYRVGHKAAPHNLYLNTEKGFIRFEEREFPRDWIWQKGLYFGEYEGIEELGEANDAIEIFVVYSGSMFDVTWVYYEETGRYMRFIGDRAQCDEGEGQEQIYADNIVMLSIPYIAAPDVPGKGQTWNLDFTGSGDAIVFRDGVRIDGTWRTDGTHPPILEDYEGNIIYLKPGKTWFQVPYDIFKTVVTTGHIEYDDPEAAVSEETDEEAVQNASDADVNE